MKVWLSDEPDTPLNWGSGRNTNNQALAQQTTRTAQLWSRSIAGWITKHNQPSHDITQTVTFTPLSQLQWAAYPQFTKYETSFQISGPAYQIGSDQAGWQNQNNFKIGLMSGARYLLSRPRSVPPMGLCFQNSRYNVCCLLSFLFVESDCMQGMISCS